MVENRLTFFKFSFLREQLFTRLDSSDYIGIPDDYVPFQRREIGGVSPDTTNTRTKLHNRREEEQRRKFWHLSPNKQQEKPFHHEQSTLSFQTRSTGRHSGWKVVSRC